MFVFLLLSAFASDPTEVRRHPSDVVTPTPPDPPSGFSFLGVTQMRMVLTDVVTDNPLLDGQIVGQLGGTNGTTTLSDRTAWYSEQRVNGFFSYQPPILDGRVGQWDSRLNTSLNFDCFLRYRWLGLSPRSLSDTNKTCRC